MRLGETSYPRIAVGAKARRRAVPKDAASAESRVILSAAAGIPLPFAGSGGSTAESLWTMLIRGVEKEAVAVDVAFRLFCDSPSRLRPRRRGESASDRRGRPS